MAGPEKAARLPESAERDGTSQAGRALAALDPDYVAVDERGAEAHLAFARAFGPKIKYAPAGGQADRTFGRFIDQSLASEEILAFLREPEKFSPETAPALFRPHFVLFLAFLKLIEKSREQVNKLTARHLDFYYREVLRMTRRPSLPDRLNVLIDLLPNKPAALLPRGALLDAGVDNLGKRRVYATERELVVSGAQLAKVSSLFVDRKRLSIRQLAMRYRNDQTRACEAIFALALGDPLPLYPDGQVVSFTKLKELHDYLLRAEKDFFLTLSELHKLMSKRNPRPPLPTELDWTEINRIIEVAGKRKSANFQLLPEDATNFAKNLWKAIGRDDIDSYFRGVLAMEAYFFLPDGAELIAEALDDVMNPLQDSWDVVYQFLELVHTEKLRSDRRAQLVQLYRSTTPPQRLVNLIRYVLGERAAAAEDPTALDRIAPFLSKNDFTDLKKAASSFDSKDVQKADCDKVFGLLEVAQRNRIGEPLPEKEELHNFHAAEDATSVVRPHASQGAQDVPRWAIFGMAQPSSVTNVPQPLLGWALSSPLLLLSEGKRVITLTLGFRPAGVPIASLFRAVDALPLRFELSSAQGFITCELLPVDPKAAEPSATVAVVAQAAATPATYKSMTGSTRTEDEKLDAVQFVLTLKKSAAALSAPPKKLSPASGPWPLLRLMLQPLWSTDLKQHIVLYQELGQRVLVAAHLKVSVSELASLKLKNDDATLDSKKPFEPFTLHPAVGSRLLIGHRELVGKPLDSLALKLQWMGAPGNLVRHYANYETVKSIGPDPNSKDPPNITARLSLIDHDESLELAGSALLFAAPTQEPIAKSPVLIDLKTLPAAAGLPASGTIAEGWLDEDLSQWRRYLQLELLAPDFQHGAYPALAARLSVQLATAMVNKASGTEIQASAYTLNPPYTPKLKSLTIDYTASAELRLERAPRAQDAHRIFHIHPFGTCDSEAERTDDGLPFLPQFPNDGELYLGLRDVAPTQTVTILFQMIEGSGNPDKTPQPVRWSYLSGNRWLPLDDQVLSDTTRGLLNTGIVELVLPPAEPSTRLGGGLYYLRATMAKDTDAPCDCCGIHTQAVTAVFVDRQNSPDHFRVPLPAGTIASIVAAPPEIAGVRQPYTSWGGTSAEGDSMWATRVSERLRHKQRALSPWDYERLILDRFPGLYKVKCIPASRSAPGQVTVVVIPDIRDRLPFEPFEPKAPLNLLADVREYVSALAPAFATVSVQNAHYTAVSVRLGVRFRGTGNDEFYQKKLCEELCRFLCPWAYEDGVDIVIGGRIYASSIINFVDRRPYVDYIAGISLFSSEDGETFRPVSHQAQAGPDVDTSEGYFVSASRPDGVLLAARTHIIDLLAEDLYEEKRMTGINYMTLGLDFIVGAS